MLKNFRLEITLSAHTSTNQSPKEPKISLFEFMSVAINELIFSSRKKECKRHKTTCTYFQSFKLFSSENSHTHTYRWSLSASSQLKSVKDKPSDHSSLTPSILQSNCKLITSVFASRCTNFITTKLVKFVFHSRPSHPNQCWLTIQWYTNHISATTFGIQSSKNSSKKVNLKSNLTFAKCKCTNISMHLILISSLITTTTPLNKDMSRTPSVNSFEEELENDLLYCDSVESPPPSLDSTIRNISGDLGNLSVTNQPHLHKKPFDLGNKTSTSDALATRGILVQSEPFNSALSSNTSDPLKASTPSNPKRKLDSSFQEELNPIKKFRSVFNMFAAVTGAAAEAHVVDILPNADGEPQLSESQGKAIKSSIMRALFSDNNMAKLRFENSGLERGKYRIVCADITTKEWVIDIVPKLDGLWQGANLKVVATGPPPVLNRATVILQLPTPEPDDFFKIIATQNPTLDTTNWKLYSRSKAQNGKQQWVIGVEDNTIPELRNLNFRPYCGMTRVRITLSNFNANHSQKH